MGTLREMKVGRCRTTLPTSCCRAAGLTSSRPPAEQGLNLETSSVAGLETAKDKLCTVIELRREGRARQARARLSPLDSSIHHLAPRSRLAGPLYARNHFKAVWHLSLVRPVPVAPSCELSSSRSRGLTPRLAPSPPRRVPSLLPPPCACALLLCAPSPCLSPRAARRTTVTAGASPFSFVVALSARPLPEAERARASSLTG